MPEQSLADANESVIAEFRANGGHVGGYFAAVPRRCSPRPARNPGCYHNLVANCEVTVELGVGSSGSRRRRTRFSAKNATSCSSDTPPPNHNSPATRPRRRARSPSSRSCGRRERTQTTRAKNSQSNQAPPTVTVVALDELSIAPCDPSSPLAASMLSRYFAELDDRFPGGFMVEQSGPAPIEEFVAPSGAYLIASIGTDAVGCGAVRKLDECSGEIKRMWIDPGSRGRGVGGRLLAALEHAARALGCTTVSLDTSRHLPEAIGLYRANGYEEIPAYNDNPYAAYWFRKTLS